MKLWASLPCEQKWDFVNILPAVYKSLVMIQMLRIFGLFLKKTSNNYAADNVIDFTEKEDSSSFLIHCSMYFFLLFISGILFH